MPASFQDILNSRLFKFVVGGKVDGLATEFFVHEEAIVQLSKPLEALMRGGMAESKAACTVWDEVGKETFERFVQFAYTGDYTVPECTPQAREEEDPSEVFDVENRSPNDTGSRKKKKKRGIEPRLEIPPPEAPSVLAADFARLAFPLLAARNNFHHACEPTDQFDPETSYSNVFISHAALYILGDFQLVDSLKALALYKLHKTLCVFQISAENIKDVIDLARYVYVEEGGEEGSDGEMGALRGLVCRYMAVNALVLSLDNGFIELLGEGGQFVKDFFKFEVQRVS